jgi:tetratricopeptide (TPR) repeat protein
VAIICTRLQQFRESLPYYRKALQHDSDNAVLHYHYAMTLAGLDEIPAAIAEYQKTVALDPAGPDAHFNLATLLEDLDPVASRTHYEQVIQLNPQDAEAFFRLGQLIEKEDPVRATGHYQRALQIKPGYVLAQTQLNQLLEKSEKDLPD